jgi:hypothetical protein
LLKYSLQGAIAKRIAPAASGGLQQTPNPPYGHAKQTLKEINSDVIST